MPRHRCDDAVRINLTNPIVRRIRNVQAAVRAKHDVPDAVKESRCRRSPVASKARAETVAREGVNDAVRADLANAATFPAVEATVASDGDAGGLVQPCRRSRATIAREPLLAISSHPLDDDRQGSSGSVGAVPEVQGAPDIVAVVNAEAPPAKSFGPAVPRTDGPIPATPEGQLLARLATRDRNAISVVAKLRYSPVDSIVS